MTTATETQPPNGTLTPADARAILETEARNKKAHKPNKPPPASPDVTPQEVLKQILALADSLGYQLGVIALTPKTRTQIPIVEYLPDGVQVAIMPFKKSLDGD